MPYHLVAPTGTRVPLPLQPIRFGTDSTADVRLSPILELAPLHFVLQPNGLGFSLEVLTPEFPVFVNDAPVNYTELRNGDRIKAGRFEVMYEADEVQAPVMPPPQYAMPQPAAMMADAPGSLPPMPEMAPQPMAEALPAPPTMPTVPELPAAAPEPPSAFFQAQEPPAPPPPPQVPVPPLEPPTAIKPASQPMAANDQPPVTSPAPAAATSAFFTEEPVIPAQPAPKPAGGYHQVGDPVVPEPEQEGADSFRLFATRPGLPEQRTVLTMGSYVRPTFPIVSAKAQDLQLQPAAAPVENLAQAPKTTAPAKRSGLHIGVAMAAAFLLAGIGWAGLETLRPTWGGSPATVALKVLCHLGGCWALGQAIGKLINTSTHTPATKRRSAAVISMLGSVLVSSLLIMLPVGNASMSFMQDGIWCLINHVANLRDVIGASISWTDVFVQMLEPWAMLGLLLATFAAWKHADES